MIFVKTSEIFRALETRPTQNRFGWLSLSVSFELQLDKLCCFHGRVEVVVELQVKPTLSSLRVYRGDGTVEGSVHNRAKSRNARN